MFLERDLCQGQSSVICKNLHVQPQRRSEKPEFWVIFEVAVYVSFVCLVTARHSLELRRVHAPQDPLVSPQTLVLQLIYCTELNKVKKYFCISTL